MKSKRNTQEPSGSGSRVGTESRTRERSGSSERRSPERRTSGSPERRRTRRSSSERRNMPKYLYQIDMPEDLREALRVSNFLFIFTI